jgi:hypothetical protein
VKKEPLKKVISKSMKDNKKERDKEDKKGKERNLMLQGHIWSF